MTDENSTNFQKLTADIVASYVRGNTVVPEQLPALICNVHTALTTAGTPGTPDPETPVPFVNPKRSVFEDYIICLEDGKKLKMLKRHLQRTYNMSPEAYRARWKLPPSYPMTAPGYSKKRTRLARQAGLGRKKGTADTKPEVADAPAELDVTVRQIPEKRRGRPQKL